MLVCQRSQVEGSIRGWVELELSSCQAFRPATTLPPITVPLESGITVRL